VLWKARQTWGIARGKRNTLQKTAKVAELHKNGEEATRRSTPSVEALKGNGARGSRSAKRSGGSGDTRGDKRNGRKCGTKGALLGKRVDRSRNVYSAKGSLAQNNKQIRGKGKACKDKTMLQKRKKREAMKAGLKLR